MNGNRRRDRNYKWRRRNGRLALPGFHVADVDWPAKLIALGKLRPDQEDDKDAIREATIRFLDEVRVGQVTERR